MHTVRRAGRGAESLSSPPYFGVTMDRTEWTDRRIDERMVAIDATFERIHHSLDRLDEDMRALRHDLFGEFRALRSDIAEDNRALRAELSQDIRALRSDFSRMQDRLSQIGFGLVAALLSSLVALIVALV